MLLILTSAIDQSNALLGDMPIEFIGNYFVTFYTKHLVLEFIGIYIGQVIPLDFIGNE